MLPLAGAEKFVLKFPHAVLNSFIDSFPIVQQLATLNETQLMVRLLISIPSARTSSARSVLCFQIQAFNLWPKCPQERFLVSRWPDAVGPLPFGPEAVALMRLVVQVQSPAAQPTVVEAFHALSDDDRETLAIEMARTGIVGQACMLEAAVLLQFYVYSRS